VVYGRHRRPGDIACRLQQPPNNDNIVFVVAGAWGSTWGL
jgi:hypothetical protein